MIRSLDFYHLCSKSWNFSKLYSQSFISRNCTRKLLTTDRIMQSSNHDAMHSVYKIVNASKTMLSGNYTLSSEVKDSFSERFINIIQWLFAIEIKFCYFIMFLVLLKILHHAYNATKSIIHKVGHVYHVIY